VYIVTVPETATGGKVGMEARANNTPRHAAGSGQLGSAARVNHLVAMACCYRVDFATLFYDCLTSVWFPVRPLFRERDPS
jgi:hypothetical protein